MLDWLYAHRWTDAPLALGIVLFLLLLLTRWRLR